MKKILNIFFCIFLLVSCKKVDNNSSSSSSKISSTISLEEPIKTKGEYLAGALASLLLVHNYLEVDINIDREKYSLDFYYDFNNNIYQIKTSNTYLTYRNNSLYIDNSLNHYYFDIGYFNVLDTMSSILNIDNINIESLEIEKEESMVILSYNISIDTFIKIYIEDRTLPTLTKLTISYNTYNLTIKPFNKQEGYNNIENYDHQNLNESLKFFTDYLGSINKSKLDIAFSYLSENTSVIGNINTNNNNIIGNIEYKNEEDSYNIIYNNELIINNEKINNLTLLKIIIKNINKIFIIDKLSYLNNLLSSEIIIEENLIQFVKENFKEEIKFIFGETLIITLEYLDMTIEIREIVE